MSETIYELLNTHQIRKTKAQKAAFLQWLTPLAIKHGYAVTTEKGPCGAKNIILGDPDHANVVFTAHYDTCAVMPFPNFITPKCVPLYLLYQVVITLVIFIVAGTVSLAAAAIHPVLAPLMYGAVLLALILLMICGPANKHTANDNTSGVVTVLETARTLPENLRDRVCFVLFDLEEAGLIGSASYRKTHLQATNKQLILNLDCVGDGDVLRMFPTKALRADRVKLTSLYKACGYFGNKNILLHEKGFSVYPSDQKNFPYGVGIAALKKGKFGLYLDKIHTKKDTVLEETNVNILRAALTSFICCDS